MGSRGPKPLSKSALVARNSRLASSRNDAGHIEGDCACPGWLEADGKAKWAELYPLLAAVPGLMRPAYVDALALYCEAYEDFLDARKRLKDHGTATVESEKGGLYLHPDYNRKRAAAKAMREWGGLFGLSPADSTKINGSGGDSGTDPDDEFADLTRPSAN